MRPAFFRFLRPLTTRSGPPVRVGYTPDAGRGVFASRDLCIGELIHTAEPLVAHPTLQNVNRVCYFCLKWLPHICEEGNFVKEQSHTMGCVGSGNNGLRPAFCSECWIGSSKAFYEVEKRADWNGFHQFCRIMGLVVNDHRIYGFSGLVAFDGEQSLRLPLLAKRFVCMVLSGAVSKDALDILSYAIPQCDVASCWMSTWELLLESFKNSDIFKEKLISLSAEWYVGILARISLNSFRIEVPDQENTNLLAAAAASVSGNAINGSGVYILPSMYNHDCDPNVDIAWHTNSVARLTALRDIKEGEELRITYIDAAMPRSSRQRLLQESYNFLCNCARCRDDD